MGKGYHKLDKAERSVKISNVSLSQWLSKKAIVPLPQETFLRSKGALESLQ